MKKILYIFLVLVLFSCSSDDGDVNDLSGFEQYEGTWGPTSYTLKGTVYDCDPNSPGVNNIDRISFIRYKYPEIILRIEYFYNGSWEHRYDESLYWENGQFYKTALDGNKTVKGRQYNEITLSGNKLLHTAYPGVTFVKVK